MQDQSNLKYYITRNTFGNSSKICRTRLRLLAILRKIYIFGGNGAVFVNFKFFWFVLTLSQLKLLHCGEVIFLRIITNFFSEKFVIRRLDWSKKKIYICMSILNPSNVIRFSFRKWKKQLSRFRRL